MFLTAIVTFRLLTYARQRRFMASNFKKCTVCGVEWASRNDFISDPDIEFIGYQVDFDILTAGLFLFNHSCFGTLAIPAGEFTDLYDGQVFETRKTGSAFCEKHCLHVYDLAPCPAKCECSYVREVIQLIKSWPRTGKKAR